MAFIVAGIVFIVTLIWAGIQLGGAAMSDSPEVAADAGRGAAITMSIGTLLTVAIITSHWWPRLHW